jgi:hypothetical protein
MTTAKHKIALRITSKARNEILMKLVDRFGSVKAAAKEIGVSNATLGGWINFKWQPSTHGISKRPKFFNRLIPKLEELTGENFRTIFPDLPDQVLKFLCKPKTVVKEISTTRLTHAVEREKLAYQSQATALIENQEAKTDIATVLATFSVRERAIISMRFGLNGEGTHTLEECGHVFKITRERVRGIEARVLRHMRTGPRMEALAAHFESDVYPMPINWRSTSELSPGAKRRLDRLDRRETLNFLHQITGDSLRPCDQDVKQQILDWKARMIDDADIAAEFSKSLSNADKPALPA